MKAILTLIFFVKIIYSYLTNNYKYKSLNFDHSNNKSSWLNNDYKTNEGIDMRFSNITDHDKNKKSLKILEENLKKIILLQKLKNNKTSIQQKIEIIDKSDFIEKSSYVITLHAGGLMDDFNHHF
jgi:hypothetical protein